MKFILALGVGFIMVSPADAQWGVRAGEAIVPPWGNDDHPLYGLPVPPHGDGRGGGCWSIPDLGERERCRQHRVWQGGW